jgi:hypothetical protein
MSTRLDTIPLFTKNRAVVSVATAPILAAPIDRARAGEGRATALSSRP